jgi:hypothetical protein
MMVVMGIPATTNQSIERGNRHTMHPTPATMIELDVRFVAHSESICTATVEMQNLGIALTLIHETNNNDAVLYDLVPMLPSGRDVTPHITLQEGESLTIIAREYGLIVGSAVCEVEPSLADSLDYILLVRSASNLLITQESVQSAAELHQITALDVLLEDATPTMTPQEKQSWH